MSAWPLSAQFENSSQRASQPALCEERLATIVPRAAPSAPAYAEIEPPPGAGDSLAVSSAKPLQVRSTSLFFLLSASSRYSITFSSGLNGARSLSPMLWMAILSSSLSETPVERCCLRRKYLPASMSELRGTRPTISVPVTRTPRAAAARHTSSKATCSGVCLMSVMFIDTWAMPYSGMYQPMALVPFSVPGIMIVLPFSSFIGLPTGEPPSRIGRPFSRTS